MQGSVVALRPVQYGNRFPEDMKDMHQVFEMRNEPNDEALLRLRYVAPLPPKSKLEQCGMCGAKFTDSFGLNRHGRIRHQPQRGPVVVDDNLGAIDLDDPGALMQRARQLQEQLKTIVPADGMFAPNPDAEAEVAAQADDKVIDELHPIAWDKTKAATKADDVKVPEVTTTKRGKA